MLCWQVAIVWPGLYIKRIKLFLFFCHIINILLTERSRSVWENLDVGRVYRPHSVRSILTTSVKILPYRPPALDYEQSLCFLIVRRERSEKKKAARKLVFRSALD